jgi:hypothetical protein
LLEIGEVIHKDDEYRDIGHHGTKWNQGHWDAGKTWKPSIFVPFRRRVRIESPGWRYLDAGETVRAGDETAFLSGTKWRDAADSFHFPYVVRCENIPSEDFRRKTVPFAG